MARKVLYLLPVVAVFITGLSWGYLRHKQMPEPSHRVLYYEDPMHPAYRSSKPGTAPDCGMDLVPVYADEVKKTNAADEPGMQGEVRIDATAQQSYGIKMARVEMNSGQGTLKVYGRVVADQTRTYKVNFGTEGYVKETANDAVGTHVTKDQHLAVVYSPEFLSVAGGFLAANEHSPGVSTSTRENAASTVTQGAASIQARADRLRNLGMSDVQIAEISRNHTVPEDVYVVAPTDGFILTRNISPGMRFERHEDLYTIADLSRVWVEADVFGRDAQAFKPGAVARITLPDSDQSMKARMSNVLPEVDPATRALRMRLEVDNPGFKLRPNMFVNVEMQVSLPPGLTVPADAVLDAGLSKRVYVQTADGRFEPRTVETGWRMNERVQIVSGLREGEMVVASGTFLVDSESRLQLASKAPDNNGSHQSKMQASSSN